MLSVSRLQVVMLVVLLLLVLLVLHPDDTAELLPTTLPAVGPPVVPSPHPLAVDVLATELPDELPLLLTEMIDWGRLELLASDGSVPMKELRSLGVLPNIEILIDRSLI